MSHRYWTRTRDLALPLDGEGLEVWELHESDSRLASFPMTVKLGKPFDVMRMKRRSAEEFRAWATQASQAVAKLYAPGAKLRHVALCPCCKEPTTTSKPLSCIHGVEYRRCASCGHVFVIDQPAPELLNRMFADNDEYADDYVSTESLQQRMNEIIGPKLDYVRAVYRRHYGRDPARAVDVGAGGGHFIACCRQNGLAAEGYELNRAACRFANRAFGVALHQEDFLAASMASGANELITYWGLLEYTPEPAAFLSAARSRLSSGNGMLIIEVPRADALGTAIQALRPDAVWRHLLPATHMNIYSDASLATLLYDHGFTPIAAWYFGMDFYELLCQQADLLGDESLLDAFGPMIQPMQAWLDAAQFVDDLIIAAVPRDAVKG